MTLPVLYNPGLVSVDTGKNKVSLEFQKKRPADWTAEDAQAFLRAAIGTIPLGYDGYRINYRMIEEHDHWDGGNGWGGHRSPEPIIATRQIADAEPLFTPDDVAGELVRNVVSGLTKQQATVLFTPPVPAEPGSEQEKEQRQRAKDRTQPLLTWWDHKGFWGAIKTAIRRAVWSGRGPLRFRISPAWLVNGRLRTDLSPDEAFEAIEVDAPLPDAAGVYTDPLTLEKAAVYKEVVRDQLRVELWRQERAPGNTAPATTRVKLLTESGAITPAGDEGLRIGGRLPILELRLDPILTEPIRRGNKQLNFSRTVLGRTVEAAGFKQRFIKNAEPNLMWLTERPTMVPVIKEDTSTGRRLYGVRAPWLFGAGTTAELIGWADTDKDKKVTRATPDVTVDEPTDTQFVVQPIKEIATWLYQRAQQGHLATISEAQLSGAAYMQQRALFEDDLEDRKNPTENFIREALETVIAIVAVMAPEFRTFLEEYRITVNLHINAGPVTPDEARSVAELRDKRLISQSTAMSRVGVDDIRSEGQEIQSDPFIQAELELKRAQVYKAWVDAGIDALNAAERAGLSPEEARQLATVRTPAPAPAPASADQRSSTRAPNLTAA